MRFNNKSNNYSRKEFMKNVGGTLLGGGLLSGLGFSSKAMAGAEKEAPENRPAAINLDRIAADPTEIPGPVTHSSPKTHEITIETSEPIAEIEDGAQYQLMNVVETVPEPMIRVPRGGTL